MRRMLLALLCAAPLAAGIPVEEEPQQLPVQEVQVVETAYFTSMGCGLEGCADPAHYHYCAAGCTDPTHYHSCPVGCTDATHPYCGLCWETDSQPEPDFWTSMGCGLEECTDPTHYHHCAAGCTDPTHYHSCPVGCTDPTHPRCGQCWQEADEDVVPPCHGGMGYGHHGSHRGRRGGWHH